MTNDLNIAPQTLMQGDNLGFLRALNSECIDLIATDPPFNKGKDFHATPDKLEGKDTRFQDRWDWDKDVDEAWADEIQDDWPGVWSVIYWSRMTYGDDMAAFLCWLGVRTLEMHRVLKPGGAFWLHCDSTASHYLKAMLDAIFGRKQFRNEVVWDYGKVSNAAAGKFLRGHDTIFYYVKEGGTPTFNRLYNAELSERKKQLVETGYNTKRMNGDRYLYIYDRAKVDARIEAGQFALDDFDIVREVDTSRGNPITDIWEIDHLNSQAKNNTGYPTQKPTDLYERMIEATSNDGDVVLDPFCGCATTLIAAYKLQRPWLGMDLWKGARAVLQARVEDELPPGLWHQKPAQLITTPPDRSDGGDVAAPHLPAKMKRQPSREPTQARQEMRAQLYEEQDGRCLGCNVALPERYFELDHRDPRSGGGSNHISNRALLCGPCNRLKGDALTIPALQREAKKRGWLQPAERRVA